MAGQAELCPQAVSPCRVPAGASRCHKAPGLISMGSPWGAPGPTAARGLALAASTPRCRCKGRHRGQPCPLALPPHTGSHCPQHPPEQPGWLAASTTSPDTHPG